MKIEKKIKRKIKRAFRSHEKRWVLQGFCRDVSLHMLAEELAAIGTYVSRKAG